jgi:hypothetical protein
MSSGLLPTVGTKKIKKNNDVLDLKNPSDLPLTLVLCMIRLN